MAEDNKMNDFPYTKDELLCLGIYELRDLGRDIGVPSPTTLKKEPLVDAILAIIYGEAPKRKIGKGRGRPARNKPKPARNLIDLVNKVTNPEGSIYVSDNDDGLEYVFPSTSFLLGKILPYIIYKNRPTKRQGGFWCTRLDSNQRHQASEACALSS